MGSIRTIVIDDSPFMRKTISDILSSDSRVNVIATASDGEEGVQKIYKYSPDVVTLDVEMPKLDGMATLKKIMDTKPTPVIMLSGTTSANAAKTVQAISNGAVDFIAKPCGTIRLDTIKQQIIDKVIAAASAALPRQPQGETLRVGMKKQKESLAWSHARTIVAIGASTGGPRALQRILSDLPEDFSAPICIVQHMPKGFTTSLAERLNTLNRMHVKEAVHGEVMRERTVYIAPGDTHLQIADWGKGHMLKLTKQPLRNGHRPSVDVLFESLATIQDVNKLAIVLTGMGSDGAQGITSLKTTDKNAVVIAESATSSVVYGMPKAALQTNHVNYSVHLHRIGSMMAELINRPKGDVKWIQHNT